METVIVNRNFDEVYAGVLAKIKEHGFKVFDDIDQQAEATAVDLQINPTRLIIFGNPKVGTLLMQEDDEITFELPIKILLIGMGDQTKLVYRAPRDFAGADRLQERGQQIIAKMTAMYADMVESVK